jgi:hypothetical protein
VSNSLSLSLWKQAGIIDFKSRMFFCSRFYYFQISDVFLLSFLLLSLKNLALLLVLFLNVSQCARENGDLLSLLVLVEPGVLICFLFLLHLRGYIFFFPTKHSLHFCSHQIHQQRSPFTFFLPASYPPFPPQLEPFPLSLVSIGIIGI